MFGITKPISTFNFVTASEATPEKNNPQCRALVIARSIIMTYNVISVTQQKDRSRPGRHSSLKTFVKERSFAKKVLNDET